MRPAKTTIFDFRQLRDQIGPDSDVYMKRRQFFAVRLGPWIIQLRSNKIMRADRDPNPHTHPMAFFSLVLKGAYNEQLFDRTGKHKKYLWRFPFTVSWRSKDCVHNIVKLRDDQPVTTLFLSIMDTRDPNYGDWGFVELETGKYISNRVYLNRDDQAGRRAQPAEENYV